jgi:hypothetical protein
MTWGEVLLLGLALLCLLAGFLCLFLAALTFTGSLFAAGLIWLAAAALVWVLAGKVYG